MTVTLKGNVFKRLAEEEIVIPHLERALFADDWPESYNIPVDLGRHIPPPRGEIGWFYPSTHCLMDQRRLYYEIHPKYRLLLPKERFTSASMWSMIMGTAAHSIVQTQLQMAGKITSPDDVEVRARSEERRIRARLDFLLTRADGSKFPVEMKTQNSRGYDQTREALPYWECQLQVTMDLLGFKEGVIFVLEMGSPWRMQEFRIRRDEELLNVIYDKWATVLAAVKADIPPRHCCKEGSADMDKCRAKSVCWLANTQEG